MSQQRHEVIPPPDDEITQIFRDAKANLANQPPAPPKKEFIAHSSYWVERVLHQQAFKLVAPGLRRAKQSEGMILIALLLLSGIPASFGMIYYWNYSHPPVHLIGVCPDNATLSSNDCYTVQTVVINQQTTTIHVPAGTLYYDNGTSYGGTG